MKLKQLLESRQPGEYVYHASYLPDLFRGLDSIYKKGLLPSKDGYGGPGVYFAYAPDEGFYHVSKDEATMFRAKWSDLVKMYGVYPSSKDGIQRDDEEIIVPKAVPAHMLEVEYFPGEYWDIGSALGAEEHNRNRRYSFESKHIIKEYSYIDEQIVEHLIKKGYKLLGKGVDQYAFIEPSTGLVLKVFGTNVKKPTGDYHSTLSNEQYAFKVFADFCMKNKSNKFLPRFYGWETFKFEGRVYLQIRMERLFPIHDEMADTLADVAVQASLDKDYESYMDKINTDIESDPGLEQLAIHLGKDGFKKLWMTIHALSNEALKHGLGDYQGHAIDLHQDNFMFADDGHIVISDPFHVE